jgi:hypothetical protein
LFFFLIFEELAFLINIFRRKADIFLKNSERILEEIEEDWKIYENYTTSIPGYPKIIDYSPYIKKLDDFKDEEN